MSKWILIVVMAAAVALSGGIAGNTAYAGSTPINWTVAGTIVTVQVPDFTVAPPGNLPAFLIQAFVKGAPGSAQFTVLGFPDEFQPTLSQCGGGPGQSFSANDMVITFADESMIFAKLGIAGGWICFQLDGTVTAVANMTVIGGTGRYEGATGEFTGEFTSQAVGESGALIAETGTITGSIDR